MKMLISQLHKQLLKSGNLTFLALLRRCLIWQTSRHRPLRQSRIYQNYFIHQKSGLCGSLQNKPAFSRLHKKHLNSYMGCINLGSLLTFVLTVPSLVSRVPLVTSCKVCLLSIPHFSWKGH